MATTLLSQLGKEVSFRGHSGVLRRNEGSYCTDTFYIECKGARSIVVCPSAVFYNYSVVDGNIRRAR